MRTTLCRIPSDRQPVWSHCNFGTTVFNLTKSWIKQSKIKSIDAQNTTDLRPQIYTYIFVASWFLFLPIFHFFKTCFCIVLRKMALTQRSLHCARKVRLMNLLRLWENIRRISFPINNKISLITLRQLFNWTFGRFVLGE